MSYTTGMIQEVVEQVVKEKERSSQGSNIEHVQCNPMEKVHGQGMKNNP